MWKEGVSAIFGLTAIIVSGEMASAIPGVQMQFLIYMICLR